MGDKVYSIILSGGKIVSEFISFITYQGNVYNLFFQNCDWHEWVRVAMSSIHWTHAFVLYIA